MSVLENVYGNRELEDCFGVKNILRMEFFMILFFH